MLAVPYKPQVNLSQFFQSSFNVALARSAPMSLFRFYFYILGIFYMMACGEHRQQIAHAVRSYPATDTPWPKREFLVWKTYRGIFEHYVEKMVNAYHPTQRLESYLSAQSIVCNEDWLNRAANQQRGMIMVSGHFGAVEYLPLFLALRDYRPAMIMRFKTARLRQECMERCRQFDVQAIDADQPHAALRALRAVKQGRILITLCDEFSHWRPYRDRYITVLGRRMRRDRTLDILYQRHRPPACLGLVKRQNGGIALHIEPITEGNESISLAERAWQQLESNIMRFPDQWYQWRDVAQRLGTDEKRRHQVFHTPVMHPTARPALITQAM
jgi:lauroyl/myristoyl acyltransferase